MENNTGTLKRNAVKSEGDTDLPDYVGEALIENERVKVEGWIVRAEGKETFMSLRFFDQLGGLAKAMYVRASAVGG